MYILDGEFECWFFDSETDEMREKRICGPGSSIYVPSMEPHGMRNVTDKPSHFLCCICNLYVEEAV
jgi:quercetin dioxygenase-like cupin family protein